MQELQNICDTLRSELETQQALVADLQARLKTTRAKRNDDDSAAEVPLLGRQHTPTGGG